MEAKKRLVIIGSGPAGLTAAIYGARALLSTTIISGSDPGGQLMGTSLVENFPGFSKGVNGSDLMTSMIAQAENVGVKFLYETVTKVELKTPEKKIYFGEKFILADSVIISTGSSPRWLDIPGEKRLLGHGVSVCATCDGYFFRDKKVVVVGGGDSAFTEALFLSQLSSEVYLLHRRDTFKASKVLQERVKNTSNIKLILNSEISEILGENQVEEVKVKNLVTGEFISLKISGVFIAIGHKPKTDLFSEELNLDESGYIIANSEVKTNIPGVFVAGDCSDSIYRQAIVAAGSGAKAAILAERFLESV